MWLGLNSSIETHFRLSAESVKGGLRRKSSFSRELAFRPRHLGDVKRSERFKC